MSSDETSPENEPLNDDSDTFHISDSKLEPESSPEPPARKKKKRNPNPAPTQVNPFEEEFERQKREAKRDAQAARKLNTESGEGDTDNLPRKRKTIVDTTKRPNETLISSFLYPFYRDGIKMVIAYGFFIFIAQLMSLLPFVGSALQPIAFMLVGIFVGLMLLETANDTLEKQGSGVEWPDIGLDSLGAGLAALGALLVAMIPLWVAIWMLAKFAADDEPLGEVPELFVIWCALSLGLLYLPMSFIALAELENEKAFNPIPVFSRIFQMFGSYLAIVGMILVLFLGLQFLLRAFEEMKLYNEGMVKLTTSFIRLIAFVYLSTVLIRAVGLSFNEHELSFETEYEEDE